jgi:hypothetical protein
MRSTTMSIKSLSQMKHLDKTTIILRECGERTADAAYHLLSEVAAPGALHRVNTAPFSRCLAESFKLGIEQGREWTLCIDADVLVTAVGICELQVTAELLPEHVFEVQGLIQDRFFGIRRPAGNHLYRTCYLERALELIPEEGTSLRPESSTIDRMRELGFVDLQLPTLTGLHDYEQHYNDIYRKCFLQGKKHDFFKDFLLPRWHREADAGNTEAVIAHAAMTAGLEFEGDVLVDRHFMEEDIEKVLSRLGIEPRNVLDPYFITSEWIDEQIHKARLGLNPAALKEQARLNTWLFAKTIDKSKSHQINVPLPATMPLSDIVKSLVSLPRRVAKRLFS